jgi:hypothetical protein
MATLPRARRRRPTWPRSVPATAVSLLHGGPAIAAPSRGPGTEALGYPFGLPCGGGEIACAGEGELRWRSVANQLDRK